jgi:hypothetical protein
MCCVLVSDTAAYWGPLGIRDISTVIISTTATPLFIKPTDLLNQLRLLSIGSYHLELDNCKKEIAKRLCNAKCAMGPEAKKQTAKITKHHLQGKHSRGKTTPDPISTEQVAIVKELRERYANRLIQQRPNSNNSASKEISGLPPKLLHTGWVILSNKEHKVLDGIQHNIEGQYIVFFFLVSPSVVLKHDPSSSAESRAGGGISWHM